MTLHDKTRKVPFVLYQKEIYPLAGLFLTTCSCPTDAFSLASSEKWSDMSEEFHM